MSYCKQCPLNHYSSFSATTCTRCPIGFESNADATSCVPVNSGTASTNSTTSNSYSIYSLVYTALVFFIFYKVTEYCLETIDEQLQGTGALLKITLVSCMILVGQILPFDADAHLLAYVSVQVLVSTFLTLTLLSFSQAGVIRVNQFSNWLNLGLSAFHLTVLRAAVALLTSVLYGSILIIVLEAGFVAYYFATLKK